MIQDTPNQKTEPTIADRLRGVVVSRRAELDVSRHVFRDGPAYVLRDPVSFSTTRLDPSDYRVFNAIRDDKTLGEIFDELIKQEQLDRADESRFYEFILDLHQRTLLSLPVNNADALYQRFERRRRADRRSKALGFLFLRVPLINPDRFLGATMPFARWLFTRPALIAWAVLCLSALVVAIARWNDLVSPAISTLTGDNLPMLWVTLIALKGFHEFGHAYACKAFGGHVPEIGVFMILFTPVAYVDATDSWSFPSTRRRAIVSLGGMYFESIIGAIAVFVWAFTDPSALNALAYQIILLSTVVTAAFNLNPLMRYDAYYLVSDLTGIPNLRARSQAALASFIKRWILGLHLQPDAPKASPALAVFGIAQLSYKALILVTISAILVLKFGPVGIAMSGLFLLVAIGRPFMRMLRYLMSAEELAPVRPRALVTAAALLLFAIVGLGAIPLNAPIGVVGVVSYENSRAIRSPARATIHSIHARAGESVHADDPLFILESPDLIAERDELTAQLAVARASLMAASTDTPGAYSDADDALTHLSDRIAKLDADLLSLRIDAPTSARVTAVAHPRTGVIVAPGDELIRIGSGALEARFYLSAAERDATMPRVGQPIECRVAASPDRPFLGTISHIDAAGSREIANAETQLPVDPATGLTIEPYFEMRVRLESADIPTGGTVHAQLPAQRRTIVQIVHRRVSGFFNHARVASATN